METQKETTRQMEPNWSHPACWKKADDFIKKILCRKLEASNQMWLVQRGFHDSCLYILCIYALWLVFL